MKLCLLYLIYIIYIYYVSVYIYTAFSECCRHQASTTLVAHSTDGGQTAFKVGSGGWGLRRSISAAFRGFWVVFDTALDKTTGDCTEDVFLKIVGEMPVFLKMTSF